MGQNLDAYDGISIAEILVYAPFLLVAVFLGARHGFGRSSGWFFLIVLSLARIIGSALRLAAHSSPSNTKLYIGWLTLNSLGLTPLVLTLLALVGRVVGSIDRAAGPGPGPAPTPRYRRLTQLVIVAGTVLVIIGGTNVKYAAGPSGGTNIAYDAEMKAGLGLVIGGFALCCLEAVYAAARLGQAEPGERRVLLAVFLALPFIVVRLVYSCLTMYGGYTMSAWDFLGMEVVMEMIAAAIFLGVGLTLRKLVPGPPEDGSVDLPSFPYARK